MKYIYVIFLTLLMGSNFITATDSVYLAPAYFTSGMTEALGDNVRWFGAALSLIGDAIDKAGDAVYEIGDQIREEFENDHNGFFGEKFARLHPGMRAVHNSGNLVLHLAMVSALISADRIISGKINESIESVKRHKLLAKRLRELALIPHGALLSAALFPLLGGVTSMAAIVHDLYDLLFKSQDVPNNALIAAYPYQNDTCVNPNFGVTEAPPGA